MASQCTRSCYPPQLLAQEAQLTFRTKPDVAPVLVASRVIHYPTPPTPWRAFCERRAAAA